MKKRRDGHTIWIAITLVFGLWVDLAEAAPILVAETGFNDALGINSDATPNSPYQLNATVDGQGAGEAGWSGTWSVTSGPMTNSTVQNAVTFEGDGALFIERTSNTFRQWAAPQSGLFQVDQYLRFTADSRTVVYLFDESLGGINQIDSHGVVWSAFPDGTVFVTDGIGDSCGICSIEDTGFDWIPDTWHKFTTIVDVPDNTFRFFMDDIEYVAPDPLGFRGIPSQLDSVNYLEEVSGNGAYVDSLRITVPETSAVPEPSTLTLWSLGAITLVGIGWRRRKRTA